MAWMVEPLLKSLLRLSLFSLKQCIIKQLLDSVFVISGIIKVSVSVISLSLPLRLITFTKTLISNGNMTEWSPIRSVIIQVITKSDDRAAGVRFVHHEYDYRPNWTKSYYQLIIKITISEKRRIAKL